jgi:hypothetical protein
MGKRLWVMAALVAFAAVAASAAFAVSVAALGRPSCPWGASSISASYVNGHLVVSAPHATGCSGGP